MARQRYINCIIAILIFVFSQALFAQAGDNTLWRLGACEGEIIITKDGWRTVYQSGFSSPQGVLLGSNDMVQTGKGSAELNFLGGGIVVKLSENTSVVIEEFTSRVSLELLYGKLHLQSNTALVINAGNSSSSFRECDAELDYVARPGFPQPALTIYCYSGEGELATNTAATVEGAKFTIRNNEILSLEYRTPFFYVERKSLDTPHVLEEDPLFTESFWALDYTAEQPEEVEVFSQELFGESFDTMNNRDNSKRVKRGNLIMGLILIGAGAAMQGYYHFGNPREELKDTFYYGGFGSMGLGAVFLFGAAAYKSPSR